MINAMRLIVPYLIGVCTLVLDQWSKYIVRQQMSLGQSLPVIDDVFHITYIENEGVAFGLFSGHTTLFVIASCVVLIGLLFFVWHEHSKSLLLHYGVAFVVSGALGNIIDRAWKASVTDMFDLRIWPIFNIADIAVCVGFGLLLVYILFGSEEKNGKGLHSDPR